MSSISSKAVSISAGKIRRFPMWARIMGIGLIVVLVAFSAMMLSMNYVPETLDTSSTLMSDQGRYQVSYISELSPLPINQIQMWTLQVTEPNGQPVEDAVITVDGGMPQHGHGLPTVPQVTKYLGDGLYQVEGLKFHMPGWWVVKFNIVRNEMTDNVTFNLMLK
jgi:hypothetical protein